MYKIAKLITVETLAINVMFWVMLRFYLFQYRLYIHDKFVNHNRTVAKLKYWISEHAQSSDTLHKAAEYHNELNQIRSEFYLSKEFSYKPRVVELHRFTNTALRASICLAILIGIAFL